MESLGCDALFHDPCFILGALPIFLALYWAGAHKTWRFAILTLGGLAFYSLWDIRFSGLLLAAGVVDYALALRMARSSHRGRWLAASIAFNLGLLGFFKYAMFAIESARSLLEVFGAPVELPYVSIVLPLGISFFTFKTMSYTIDVYRGEVAPTRDLLKYLAFITLLADIVAGPIIRYRDMSDQLDALPRRLASRAVAIGLGLFAIGLFKKVVIADTIAHYVDRNWEFVAFMDTPTAWVTALGYTLQLYFDFSGYSDMAIGIGALLGLKLPENFRSPYQALDPSDFWRRWHISLSTWLRDYLYIPLGGSRAGGVRVHLNLLTVMVLGGLWHGAAWTFVAWGTYHGLLLVVYKLTASVWDAAPKLARRALTFFLVVLGWVLFRALSLADAFQMYAIMFSPAAWDDVLALAPLGLALLALAAFAILVPARLEPRSTRGWALAAGTLLTLCILVVSANAASPFLYYQF